MQVILHTTHCPQCKVLEAKLTQAGIEFELDEDPQHIQDLGFMSAPILEVDGSAMIFGDAIKWVAQQQQ